jgi:hypothetical protein
VYLNRMALYGDHWMAFMNTVWGPVDGCNEHGVETSGWLLCTRCKDQWKGLTNTV